MTTQEVMRLKKEIAKKYFQYGLAVGLSIGLIAVFIEMVIVNRVLL